MAAAADAHAREMEDRHAMAAHDVALAAREARRVAKMQQLTVAANHVWQLVIPGALDAAEDMWAGRANVQLAPMSTEVLPSTARPVSPTATPVKTFATYWTGMGGGGHSPVTAVSPPATPAASSPTALLPHAHAAAQASPAATTQVDPLVLEFWSDAVVPPGGALSPATGSRSPSDSGSPTATSPLPAAHSLAHYFDSDGNDDSTSLHLEAHDATEPALGAGQPSHAGTADAEGHAVHAGHASDESHEASFGDENRQAPVVEVPLVDRSDAHVASYVASILAHVGPLRWDDPGR
jgi:hypothetical protein